MDFQIGCCYWVISRGQGRGWHIDSSTNQVHFESFNPK